ncbi:MAG: SBBP repeat-containing protein [Bryobacteraceae bacterium]
MPRWRIVCLVLPLALGLSGAVIALRGAEPPSAAITVAQRIGGSGGDGITAMGSDAQGNVYVAGYTTSPDLPVTDGALKRTYAGGLCPIFIGHLRPCNDVFVAKLGPSGQIAWLTYLGGDREDIVHGIAVDAFGGVYVHGFTSSRDFPWTNPVPNTPYYVLKLSPDGSRVLWTYGLPDNIDRVAAAALDARGNLWIAANASASTNFPGLTGFRRQVEWATVYRKTSETGAWKPVFRNVTAYSVSARPGNPQVVYAGGQGVVYRSTDGGESFTASQLGADAGVFSLATQSGFPERLIAATGQGLYRSSNGGVTWTKSGQDLGFVSKVVFDPRNPDTVYAGNRQGVFKSTDAGGSWQPTGLVVTPTPFDQTYVETLVWDSNAPLLYAGTSNGLFRTANGGATWQRVVVGMDTRDRVVSLAIDPANSNVLFAGGGQSGESGKAPIRG